MTTSNSNNKSVASDRHDIKRFASSPIVTISVGPNEKKFYLHRDLLVAFSMYFEGCLNGDFVEGQQLAVRLEDVDEIPFGDFVSWLYGGSLDKEMNQPHLNTEFYFGLYVLADRLLVLNLKNDIIDSIRKRLSTRNSTLLPSVLIGFSSTGLLKSPLGSFIIECVARGFHHDLYWRTVETQKSESTAKQKDLERLCDAPEAAAEVLKCLMLNKEQNWTKPTERPGCVFHEHKDGDECSAAQSAKKVDSGT